MPTVSLGKIELHYIDAGSGDALLLLHAFPLHAGMWVPQVQALSRRRRVIAPDARGLGLSRPVPGVLTMDTIADDAAALLDHLGVERAVVCGLSMGGYAAFSFWRRHRARVSGLVLADTRAGADSEEARANRESFADTALERGIDWVAQEMSAKLQRSELLPPVDAELRRLIRDCDPAGVAAAQRGMAQRPDSSGLLPQIDVPALVIVGSDDRLTPPAEARAMAAALPRARLVEIAGAGHIASLEEPRAFNAAVEELLVSV